jgi:anti-sigma B factor antagonist
MDFSLDMDLEPPEARIKAAGELDIFTTLQLSAKLQDAVDVGCRKVLLDLAGVDFVDASALRVLDRFYCQMVSVNGALEFVSWSPPFLRLCRLTGMDSRFGLSVPIAS